MGVGHGHKVSWQFTHFTYFSSPVLMQHWCSSLLPQQTTLTLTLLSDPSLSCCPQWTQIHLGFCTCFLPIWNGMGVFYFHLSHPFPQTRSLFFPPTLISYASVSPDQISLFIIVLVYHPWRLPHLSWPAQLPDQNWTGGSSAKCWMFSQLRESKEFKIKRYKSLEDFFLCLLCWKCRVSYLGSCTGPP